MPTPHSFQIRSVPSDTYDRVTSALTALGYMTGDEISLTQLSVRLGVAYNRESKSLTLTIRGKPGFVSTGIVESRVKAWLRTQGIMTA